MMKELRNFEGQESWMFQGMCNFPDGSKPLVAVGESATLLVGGFDSTTDYGIDLIFPENHKNIVEAFKAYDDVERAKADALIFAQMLDCDLTKEFLCDIGFEVI